MHDFRELLADYGAIVYTTAWRILQHRQDTEDVVQEVFLHAWRTRHEQQVAEWGAWLRRLAVCRALDRLRLRRPATEFDPEWMATHDDPADATQLAELQEQLRIAVAELPEQERLVFSLRYFESLTNTEIAGMLAISPSAVSTALNKARGKLSVRLQSAMKGDVS